MGNEKESESLEDTNLVARIGTRDITSADVIENIIVNLGWSTIQNSLDCYLVEEEFKRRNIEASNEEIRSELTLFRQTNNLLTAVDTKKWLEANKLSDANFFDLCTYKLKLQKLKEVLFQDRLAEVFVYKRSDLREVELYKIVVAHEDSAREILSCVRDGESFFDLARKYSTDQTTSKGGGYTGRIRFSTLHPTVQDKVLKSKPGEVLGPLNIHKNFELYLLESIEDPVFESHVRQELEDELFQSWLVEERTRSRMELFV